LATTSFKNFVQKLYYLFMIIIDLWVYLPVHVLLESFSCKKWTAYRQPQINKRWPLKSSINVGEHVYNKL